MNFKVSYFKDSLFSRGILKKFQIDISKEVKGCIYTDESSFTLSGFHFKDKSDIENCSLSYEISEVSKVVNEDDTDILLINHSTTPREQSKIEVESLKAIAEFAGVDNNYTNEYSIEDVITSEMNFVGVLNYMKSEKFKEDSILGVKKIYFFIQGNSEESVILQLDKDISLIKSIKAPNNNTINIFTLSL